MALSLPLPLSIRERIDEVSDRIKQIPTELNEYGYDEFGLEPEWCARLAWSSILLYHYYFRVETRGIENVPPGRVLLIGNHAGNTLPMDGAMLWLAMLLEAEPPRITRGMAEFYLPRIPWYSQLIRRVGAVVGTPENCRRLLESEEAIMVFPEGHRGFIKPYSKAYQLQRFGSGFARLALETKTPIVPVGIVGSEEQSPGLYDSKFLGRLIGSPAFPITATFPLLGPLGFVPLPVKYRLHFGEPIWLEGDAQSDDVHVREQVDRVRDNISLLVEEALERRRGWFG
ncbi:MAG: acyltransferase family protein [Deltaproteobacteria bacterium]|nr:acyltransferase family protein [Deltaproteobacteria bacterium]